jgi:hypothetical protein
MELTMMNKNKLALLKGFNFYFDNKHDQDTNPDQQLLGFLRPDPDPSRNQC